ncbi:MAG TPA: hypothetical protein VFQ53_34705 [Kofleriaceae bacterium]|nr:hypothetical protein [Kofleriaceae bacterium]
MIKKLLKRQHPMLLLRISCVLTLVALGLMVWSMLDPTPLPVMIAMSVAQGLGTIAFGLFGYVIVQDIRRQRRERRVSQQIPVFDEKAES